MRTFSGASARRLKGISRMSGSALGAMWFMRVSMEGCIGAAGAAFSGRPAAATGMPVRSESGTPEGHSV